MWVHALLVFKLETVVRSEILATGTTWEWRHVQTGAMWSAEVHYPYPACMVIGFSPTGELMDSVSPAFSAQTFRSLNCHNHSTDLLWNHMEPPSCIILYAQHWDFMRFHIFSNDLKIEKYAAMIAMPPHAKHAKHAEMSRCPASALWLRHQAMMTPMASEVSQRNRKKTWNKWRFKTWNKHF
jgi:hypothetical protein